MNKHISTLISILSALLVVLGVMYVWGSRTEEKNTQPGGLRVAASFYPLAYLAQEIGGEFVSITDLTPAGAEPHDFEPTPRDIARLSNTTVFFYNGGNFEPWIESWNKGSFTRPPYVINMASRLGTESNLLRRRDTVDPHLWLDPVIFASEAAVVRDTLSLADPVHKDMYTERAAVLIDKLHTLDLEYREGLQSCALSHVVVSHDAFGYLAREYGFGIITIAGISPDEEPSSQTIAQIVDLARVQKIHHIFFETTVSPRLSETIAREVGAETLILHTLESLTLNEVQSGQDYLTLMRENLKNLRTARLCN